jgi:phosphatidylglycerol---prolipoprotein diacylglyceryl transferase
MRSTLFTIFGLQIRSYGLMMAVGFALGIWRAIRVSKKRYGIEPERVYDLALVLLVSGVLGARAVYILLNPATENWRDFIAVWQGGLSFHGGLAFAMIAGYVYTRIAKLPYWKCGDLVAPSLAIGYAFTRIGCFLNGCCYGCPTSLPWGVRFIDESSPLNTASHHALTAPSHPTQIYAFFANLLIFWLLTRLERIDRKPGFVFVSYLGLYSIYRFLVEFLRSGVSAQPWAFGLTQAQGASLAMLAIALVLIATVYRHGPAPPARA